MRGVSPTVVAVLRCRWLLQWTVAGGVRAESMTADLRPRANRMRTASVAWPCSTSWIRSSNSFGTFAEYGPSTALSRRLNATEGRLPIASSAP